MSAAKPPKNTPRESAPRSPLSALRSAVGAIGGRVTASRRTPAQRREAARKAALARWGRRETKSTATGRSDRLRLLPNPRRGYCAFCDKPLDQEQWVRARFEQGVFAVHTACLHGGVWCA